MVFGEPTHFSRNHDKVVYRGREKYIARYRGHDQSCKCRRYAWSLELYRQDMATFQLGWPVSSALALRIDQLVTNSSVSRA